MNCLEKIYGFLSENNWITGKIVEKKELKNCHKNLETAEKKVFAFHALHLNLFFPGGHKIHKSYLNPFKSFKTFKSFKPFKFKFCSLSFCSVFLCFVLCVLVSTFLGETSANHFTRKLCSFFAIKWHFCALTKKNIYDLKFNINITDTTNLLIDIINITYIVLRY